MFIIKSFSLGLLSAIIKVNATKVLFVIFLLNHFYKEIDFYRYPSDIITSKL